MFRPCPRPQIYKELPLPTDGNQLAPPASFLRILRAHLAVVGAVHASEERGVAMAACMLECMSTQRVG